MNELILQAVELMVVGMGFVFVFLTVLVGATTVMSKMVVRFEPAPPPVKPAAKKPATAKPAASNDPQLIAVIAAAVAEYRSRQKK